MNSLFLRNPTIFSGFGRRLACLGLLSLGFVQLGSPPHYFSIFGRHVAYMSPIWLFLFCSHWLLSDKPGLPWLPLFWRLWFLVCQAS